MSFSRPTNRSPAALPEGYSLNPSAYTHPSKAPELSAVREVAPLLQSSNRYKSFIIFIFEDLNHGDVARKDSLWSLSRRCGCFADRPFNARREPGDTHRNLWPTDRRTTAARVLSENPDDLRIVSDDHADQHEPGWERWLHRRRRIQPSRWCIGDAREHDQLELRHLSAGYRHHLALRYPDRHHLAGRQSQ